VIGSDQGLYSDHLEALHRPCTYSSVPEAVLMRTIQPYREWGQHLWWRRGCAAARIRAILVSGDSSTCFWHCPNTVVFMFCTQFVSRFRLLSIRAISPSHSDDFSVAIQVHLSFRMSSWRFSVGTSSLLAVVDERLYELHQRLCDCLEIDVKWIRCLNRDKGGDCWTSNEIDKLINWWI
jgi:hypothetical protein